MTTEQRENLCCALCGEENEYRVIGSTNSFGQPDLDTRPPEMERSTLFALVQRCPDCGYCAPDISVPSAIAKTVVSGDEYRRQLNDPAFPVLANTFLCKALLGREIGNLATATWGHIHAAWACDDANQVAQASKCRRGAAELLVLAEAEGQRVCDQDGLSTAILVDLLRRAGEIERARKVLARPLTADVDDVITLILKFQAVLLDRNDLGCHTVAEALD